MSKGIGIRLKKLALSSVLVLLCSFMQVCSHPHIIRLYDLITCKFFIQSTYAAYAIDCFKCVSNNGANPACDDPFHNNYSTAFFEAPCMGGRKGRDGLFPATSCIKLAGYFGMCPRPMFAYANNMEMATVLFIIAIIFYYY